MSHYLVVPLKRTLRAKKTKKTNDIYNIEKLYKSTRNRRCTRVAITRVSPTGCTKTDTPTTHQLPNTFTWGKKIRDEIESHPTRSDSALTLPTHSVRTLRAPMCKRRVERRARRATRDARRARTKTRRWQGSRLEQVTRASCEFAVIHDSSINYHARPYRVNRVSRARRASLFYMYSFFAAPCDRGTCTRG